MAELTPTRILATTHKEERAKSPTSDERGLQIRMNIWLSDPAYDGLRRLAGSHWRVSHYIANLPGDPTVYKDTRPTHLVEDSYYMLSLLESEDYDVASQARMPMWTLELPRAPRTLRLTKGVQEKLMIIARHWHISNHLRSDSVERTTSRLSALLEAIGLGHLSLMTATDEDEQAVATDQTPQQQGQEQDQCL